MSNIFVYGDSHANYSFQSLPMQTAMPTSSFENCHKFSITMPRIGRDNHIVNFDPSKHNQDSVIILCYGEVDCRCHVQRQVDMGRTEDDVIADLVEAYFTTIHNNVIVYRQIIVCAIIPPMHRDKYESVHGPITHEFPFLGSDEDRVRFTQKMNVLLQKKCIEHQYTFMNPYGEYTDEYGCLKYELSDTMCHVKDSTMIAEHTRNIIESSMCDYDQQAWSE